jgi:ribosomal protein L33
MKKDEVICHAGLYRLRWVSEHSLFMKYEKHNWITRGIKISCKQKRNLYALTKNSNDPVRKAHYNKYCKILRKVIREAKK